MGKKILSASDFIPFNEFEGTFPIKVNLVYAQEAHPDNHFKNLYHADATQLWAYKAVVPVALLASLICRKQFDWTLKLNDCFRPVEAQEKMARYGYDPALVSMPGTGAHPRGMAIDIQPIRRNGDFEEMGTPFDYFAPHLVLLC